jgi:arylsulfatase A-like enzyme
MEHSWYPPSPASDGAIALSGKGVVEGKRAARVNLVDVAPTLSHVLGIHPPNDAEGRIVWQAFTCDDPPTR